MHVFGYSLILVNPFERTLFFYPYSKSCLRCKFFPVISDLSEWSLFLAIGSGSSENVGAYRNSLLLKQPGENLRTF